MSTRCTINFNYSPSSTAAKVYRHSDGYPEAVLPDLERFFADVQAQTTDTRFSDPTYLAAKFLVWQAGELSPYYDRLQVDGPSPLAFIGLGICLEDPGDIEYTYHVDSSRLVKGVPTVTHKSV